MRILGRHRIHRDVVRKAAVQVKRCSLGVLVIEVEAADLVDVRAHFEARGSSKKLLQQGEGEHVVGHARVDVIRPHLRQGVQRPRTWEEL